ncbi:hypothetical protein EPUS_01914 [Endocarpon pusillum Z07020]|uniref:tyrosinase n=1 Tax=Endocarpon pusillum (strain Z07020 / HMAS-L-300199) TaxID=1263415 RepID=U1HKV1_ENDPU|nr:uncharacterized protein EPUS_01914 [Endocarpon pusillum Z07020]ERF69584.1 hypothetical protein EPUS_01914 [Endocarpon pusillum Z07020]
MFLLALSALQNVTENNDNSYFRVAGIHGYPFAPWQEDPGFVPANPNRGYCTHSSALFTTWHRPYLVLLEQMLCDQARSIAQQFQGYDAGRWQAAAEEVRLPYWDWSSTTTQSRIPAALKQPSISVNTPSGQATIANPMYSYKFLSPQPAASGFGPQTVQGAGDDELFSSFESRRQATLNMFTGTDYNQFNIELENIHNTIHVQIGGDMVFVPRSGYVPIFFLHHANVDRLTAMYQATHPGLTLTPRRRSPTFALGGAGPDDLNTPLYPFRHPDRRLWTSNDVSTAESIFTYGYSYPDVPQGLPRQELQSFTTERVNELYAPQPASPALARFFTGDESGVPGSPTTRLEWSANVQVRGNEVVGSFRIQVFIDAFLAGVASNFADARMPMSTPNDQINASLPLTPTLVRQNVGLSPDETVPVLEEKLKWVVERRTDDGTAFIPISTADLSSLVVSVFSNEADYPTDTSQLPTKGEPVTYYEPTAGKVGGLQPGQGPTVGVQTGNGNGTSPASTRMRKVRL